ncbi:MAG TPA: non-lysosomal glucosylceramidase [Paracoccaceae bacterium]|nr:non-lysosomal glucosylceramidase [Paracoccaceae bacterium]
MRRNDPFAPPDATLSRPAGHVPQAARPKMAGLFAPLGPTGVPLGGIGTGTVTRASDGRFSRWTLKAGGVRVFDMPANGFLLRVARPGRPPAARALQPAPAGREMAAFGWEPEAPEWHGLFPLAWHRHAALERVSAECLSFSPVIPGDLETASLPVALFRWRLTNAGDAPAEVSVMLTFANLTGWFHDLGEGRPPRCAAGLWNEAADFPGAAAVIMGRRTAGPPDEGDGQFALAVAAPGAALSRTVAFDATGDGAGLWTGFLATGGAPDLGPCWLTESGFREAPPAHPAGAVSARMRIAPGETAEATFALAWDLPAIAFGSGRRWWRGYTETWGRGGGRAAEIAAHALDRADGWLAAVQDGQARLAEGLGDGPDRAGFALNEAYFLTEGLAVLTAARGAPDGRRHFGLIECHDYALYNTLDLWVYAAEAVGRWFPALEAMVAEDFAAATLAQDATPRRLTHGGALLPLNPPGSCPHDLGGPGEDPFVRPNSYTWRDATRWKDLNCDLVLCIWRAGRRMGPGWRAGLYPAVKAAIDHLQRHDTDGDGLIENDGPPDQTFDNLPMKGASSYCGGLWVAALLAGARIADEAGQGAQARDWDAQAARARAALVEKLWNGRYFRVDTDGAFSDASFIEQLLGPYLARDLGLGEIVPDAMARAALSHVFRANFLDEGGGEGAVSVAGMSAAVRAGLPHAADTSFQTSEIQPGFNLSLAAQMERWGLWDEGAALRRALRRELHETRNLVFQTPAAYDRGRDTARAILNMRALAAWWMRVPPGA